MKATLKVLFVLVLSGYAGLVFGQSNIIEAHLKSKEFVFGSMTKMIKDYKLQGCINSALFAKFTIDTMGNVSQLNISGIAKQTPDILVKIFKDLIKTSNGQWIPRTVEGKKTESIPFVLPFIFSFNSCSTTLSNDDLYSALMNITNFNGNDAPDKYVPINCILLPPTLYIEVN